MINKNISIKLTNHAQAKINQRNISLDDIKDVVLNPESTELDKFDNSLVHFLSQKTGRFLRVIGRWKSEKDLLIISAFFDRRLLKGGKNDKN